jgi:hypothetical protein
MDFCNLHSNSPGANTTAIQVIKDKLLEPTTMLFVVSAYESASTSMFKMGRTECIRPCTKEAQACCDEYLNENLDKKKFSELIRAAIKRHNQQTKVRFSILIASQNLSGLPWRQRLGSPHFWTENSACGAASPNARGFWNASFRRIV